MAPARVAPPARGHDRLGRNHRATRERRAARERPGGAGTTGTAGTTGSAGSAGPGRPARPVRPARPGRRERRGPRARPVPTGTGGRGGTTGTAGTAGRRAAAAPPARRGRPAPAARRHGGFRGVTVQLSQTHQTIQGFGINDNWGQASFELRCRHALQHLGHRDRPHHSAHRHERERRLHQQLRIDKHLGREDPGRHQRQDHRVGLEPARQLQGQQQHQRRRTRARRAATTRGRRRSPTSPGTNQLYAMSIGERARLRVLWQRRSVQRQLPDDALHGQRDGGLRQGGRTEAPGQGRQGHRARSVGMGCTPGPTSRPGPIRWQEQLGPAEVRLPADHDRRLHDGRRLRLRPLPGQGHGGVGRVRHPRRARVRLAGRDAVAEPMSTAESPTKRSGRPRCPA